MSNLDYTAFDKRVIQTIGNGVCTRSAIDAALSKEADEIAGLDRFGCPRGWRLIDRRLQALRKRGAIAFDQKTGWRIK